MEGKLDGTVTIWQMNSSDFKAAHTFGDDKKVTPKVQVLKVNSGDTHTFGYSFPAHSLTILKLRVRE